MSAAKKRTSVTDTLWDANDVASYLKISRSMVYQKAAAGILPSLHVMGLLRFDPGAIRAFARGEAPPPPPAIPIRRARAV